MTAQQTNTPAELDSDALHLLVGPNVDYYLSRWKAERKISFNWGAFLFIFFWMGYRKIYGGVAGILAVYLLIDVLAAIMRFDADPIEYCLTIAFGILLGFRGTSLYRWVVLRKLRHLETRTAPDELLEAADRRRASWTGVVIVWVMMLVYTGLFHQIGRL
ncbi:DUF2628 domain-containing protein [Sporosarcina trichiuri]|uniref:DUF2628 domain-containing protein n=1 Tax=Sporosarcina trichiuri TaxID=3056445 RepID=UPI0025B4DE13|nr:DUF2628 domain-containing protein [Sporosarcina sp. 0.2-SM1T-5]WJY28071.1 DUF2628 domain-containing protein [Sporosarcina sp. 0.2-SM1T-5]